MAQGTLFSYFGKVKKAEDKTSANTSSKEWMKPGELVWAKMEGYPYWPALITNHHVDHKFMRGSKSSQECHLQFFGDLYTRAWVSVKNLQRFDESSSNKFPSNTTELNNARQQAIGALKLSCNDRLTKLSVVILSDDEEEEESVPVRKKPKQTSPRLSAICDDGDDDIGRVKTHTSGRPKRAVSLSMTERWRLKKRKKQKLDSDESGDEYCPDNHNETSDDSCSSGVDESVVNDNHSSDNNSEECMDVTPSSKKSAISLSSSTPRRPNGISKKKSPGGVVTPSRLNSSVNTSLSSSPGGNATSSDGKFAHERLEWLKEENRKDIAGRRVSDPEYDPHTLFIPADYFKRQTPGHKQWWMEKSRHFDAVIFFKVGKFYELYHMDAVIGVQECGLAYMKGDYAHSGFPEIAYSRFAQSLVQKGYKIARVEQTETPTMMEERVKKSPAGNHKASKVVARELCSIVTKGTVTPSFLRGDSLSDTEQLFLLAVTEGTANLSSSGSHTIGVCFVDTCIGTFHLGQFTDDRHLSRFRTMTSHYKPAQVLYPRQRLSQCYHQAISTGNVLKESLSPGSEFWDESRTLKELIGGGYFSSMATDDDNFDWPKVLEEMLDSSDPVRAKVADGYRLAVSALGACMWYLHQCCIDHELLSLKSFEIYTPLDLVAVETDQSHQWNSRQRMVLDGVTLNNLDVTNGNSQLQTGTLLERMDHCVTPFGRRKLYEWVCTPLCNPDDINQRLDAVETLIQLPSAIAEVKDLMKTLPDLQRLLRRVHTLGSAVRSSNHPDSRAIMYNETTYSKRKINDFLSMISGFQTAIKIAKIFNEHDSLHDRSQLLWKLTTLTTDGGEFPNMEEQLHVFEVSFDHEKARKDGIIMPHKGVNHDYDTALTEIAQINKQLDDYLQQQRKRLNCKNIVYWGTGRNRFQLEVPESVVSRQAPQEYEAKSQKKGFRRYWTQTIEQLLQQLVDMETQRDDALKDTMRVLFHSFDEHFALWEAAVNCVGVLDCLCSLAVFSSCSDGDMCRPEIIAKATAPYLEIHAGRHPCVVQTFTGNEYIPNDTLINASQHNRCLVVTGPNMGGKSTLMRQTGLIVLLAHLGCYVPATRCSMTPVDRIFTRLGASDRITSGESTFFVELSETSTILQHATCHSLVLLDELGRGTATYDGTAIASAVVKELAEVVKCRTIFSTHYHSLVEEFADNPHITLGHMACMVEDNENDDIGEETITFLYKLIEGACPKSYGFNAARLAGIPTEVIKVAYSKAKQFEETTNQQKLFRKIVELEDATSLHQLLEQSPP